MVLTCSGQNILMKVIFKLWIPPEPLLPSGNHPALARPEKSDFEGFSLRNILAGESMDITLRSKQKASSEGEPEDALFPIFDWMKMHPLWKILKFVPCKFCPVIRAD